jgi:hypothetical protein
MVVHLHDGLERSEFLALVQRLEAEELAEGCFIAKIEPIGHPEERKLYIRLSNSKHGVLLAAADIDAKAIEWAVEALRLSVERV